MSLDIRISSEAFRDQLMKISTGIVWKNQYIANMNEKEVDPREVDQFMSAHKGIITFDGLWNIDIDILEKAGLTSKEILMAIDNKYMIPEAKRDIITSMQINRIMTTDPITGRYTNYIERNDYYRMLYGLPSIEETNFLYVPDNDKVDPTIPVHELSLSDCYYLEDIGYLEKLLYKNPSHKYLKYLGKKRINPYLSRSAERYDILWVDKSDNNTINEAFLDVYDNCRQLVLRTYFRKDLIKSNSYYEGFMAMCILFMTINLMHYKFLEADITRDFFDIESLRFIYESYGVPFFPNIPISYHKLIVKNLNILLSYKGSTRVFFELFDLFDYADIDIYLFYIMKKHRMNSQGLPIFVYDKDGNIDNMETYEVRFGQVRLYDNPPLELSNPLNQYDYTQVIADDPYWVSDSELLHKLYDQKYNYMESKYLGIRTTFDMMKIVYESAYLIKMLIDNRETLDSTLVYYNVTMNYHNIFALTIYMCAIVCKKHGYDTLISSKLPSVAKYLGYNFKADLKDVRRFILNDPRLKDDNELLENIRHMDIDSLDSINDSFGRIMNLRRFLLERMWASQHSDEYNSYKRLFNTLMTSDLIPQIFRMSDGRVAETFEDLLFDIDISLYERITKLTPEEADSELEILFNLYRKSLDNIKWINLSDGINIGPLMEQLYSLMKYFKSAKAELTGYQIVYTISTPAANFFKLLGYIESSEDEGVLSSDRVTYLLDVLNDIENMYKIRDNWYLLRDECTISEDWIFIQSKIKKLTDLIIFEEHWCISETRNLSLIDIIHMTEDSRILTSLLNLSDEYKLIIDDVLYEEMHYAIPDDRSISLRDILLSSDQECQKAFISNGLLADLLLTVVDEIWLNAKNKDSILSFGDCYEFSNSEQTHYFSFKFNDIMCQTKVESTKFYYTSAFNLDYFSNSYKYSGFWDNITNYSENSKHKDSTLFKDQIKLMEEIKLDKEES